MVKIGSKLIPSSFLIGLSLATASPCNAAPTYSGETTSHIDKSTQKKIALKKCSSGDYAAAQTTSFQVRSWKDYYSWYITYGNCNEGEVGEHISDVTEKLLGVHWGDFIKTQATHLESDMRFGSSVKNSKKYLEFIVNNVSSVSDGALMETIARQAHERCVPGMREVCEKIAEKAMYIAKGGS